MTRDGYSIQEAADGDAGLAAIASRAPDLVLLDVNMPGKDGFAVLRELRSRKEGRDVPVILLTAQGDEKTSALAFELGAQDHLGKPFTVPQLNSRVRAVLARQARSTTTASD